MQKQIAFPRIIPRLFSSIADFMLMTFILMPFSNIISNILFVNMFKPYLIHNAIKITDTKSVMQVLLSEEFANRYFGTTEIIHYMILNTTIPLLMIGIYFCCFWHYTSTTPGKYLFNIKIVDANDMKSPPTIKQSIIRFLLSPLGFVLIWFSLFSLRRQALHDKVAETVLIKR